MAYLVLCCNHYGTFNQSNILNIADLPVVFIFGQEKVVVVKYNLTTACY